ncbi:MAG: TadE/TadG family protein [Halioglobus sp.]|nr:TadE/TadG family protein [Nitratireductor sp.]MCB1676530.1 TadE/TadG family protein [Halioglobus sp.]
MTRQFSILRRYREFLANQSGNFGIIFAICAFPAIGAASLALDYSNMSRERNMVQHSLDAAALATAKQMASGTTGAALEQYARDFFDANLPSSIAANRIDLDVTVKTEMVPNEDGEMVQQKTLGLDAKLDYDTFIATVMGQDQIEIGIASQVAMGNMTVEVALVIDNSGSMGSNSRMTLAKSTAKDLIETVYNAASFSNKPDPVKFSLVPFAASVNIGTNNQNQTWMDRNGWSPIHHENLNWNEYDTPNTVRSNRTGWQERINGSWKWRTRHDVYALMGASWQGCVEMRPWPYNTTDDIALLSNTSGYNRVRNNSSDDLKKQLFVPMFAPSEPYRYYTYKDYRGYMRTGYDWYSYGYNYTYDWKRSNNVTFESDASNRQANQNSRQNWIFRYQNNSLWSGVTRDGQGPNYGCTTNALTDLTKNQTTIENAVDAMQPNGNTNIQEGVAWGWRTLSPTEPFTEGRAYDDAENRKYMIVLTDGNNTYSTTSNPNGTYYGAWGYGKHGRIDEGLSNSDLAGTPYVGQNLNSYEKKMNAHTVQTCNNAKAAGVTVFTIAFDVRDGSSVKEMLNACAGSGVVDGEPVLSSGNFYFDVNGAGIQDAMASIASQISDMRIMK